MMLKKYLVEVADIFRVEVVAYTEEDASLYAKEYENCQDYCEQRIVRMTCLGAADGEGEDGDTVLRNEDDQP